MTIPYPPPDPDLSGASVLLDVEAFIRRYVAFPSDHCFTAVTLWAAHTHAPSKTFYVTPRLVLDSAEPGSGKTRVLELLALLVLRPEMTISATVAAIFRMLAEKPYTLLFDEVDAIFNPKNGGNYEDLRALLNAGYKQGSTIARCVGDAKSMKVQRFTVFAPVALAGIAGNMPTTITTRAVTIHMRRRAPGEKVAPFRERDAEVEAEPLRDRLSEWVENVANDLAYARPKMPEGVEDRPAEVWEALLAVADAAGGDWPKKARAACRFFVLNADPGEVSRGIRLLRDIKALFDSRKVDQLPSQSIVSALKADEEAPWSDLGYGKALEVRRLASELKRYGVESKSIRVELDGQEKVLRGYTVAGADGLGDAWNRYLPEAATSATSATGQVGPVADEPAVADTNATSPPSATGATSAVAPVADVADESRPHVTDAWSHRTAAPSARPTRRTRS